MNTKPNSINPNIAHRVQQFGFIKVAIVSGLITTGAIALAYDSKPTEYKPPVTSPNTTPTVYEVQKLTLDSKHSGTAKIKLDNYILQVGFDFQAHPDSYGVPGSEFTAIEITNLSIDDVKSINGAEFSDFTDYNDHRNINQLIASFIERHQLVEAS